MLHRQFQELTAFLQILVLRIRSTILEKKEMKKWTKKSIHFFPWIWSREGWLALFLGSGSFVREHSKQNMSAIFRPSTKTDIWNYRIFFFDLYRYLKTIIFILFTYSVSPFACVSLSALYNWDLDWIKCTRIMILTFLKKVKIVFEVVMAVSSIQIPDTIALLFSVCFFNLSVF